MNVSNGDVSLRETLWAVKPRYLECPKYSLFDVTETENSVSLVESTKGETRGEELYTSA